MKTDRRDALSLARLFRSGELTYVHLPDEADEAIRDLMRTRLRAVEDLRRCRQRIKGFLLRYGRRYSGRSSWTDEHLNYLSRQKFDYPGQQIAFEELLTAAQDPAQRIERLTQAMSEQVKTWPRLPLVQALMCLRGMGLINAVTCVCEIGDFSRFEHPRPLMSFVGMTPSEDSSGKRRRQGSITQAGNDACRRAIIEAAWQYRLPARVTPTIRQRQKGQPKAVIDLAWKAQTRLCARYRSLIAQRKKPAVAITAVGRELVGFLWAIAQLLERKPVPTRDQAPTTPPAPVRAPGRNGRTGARLASPLERGSAPASSAQVYSLKASRTYQEPVKTRRAAIK